ncbi:efflux transporter outer membrane subunit [Herbaspirillum sp. YR522]|uniref:efflux transporter outer membrane subunit n=1 Tax=Herbaspirillum sp. YR522 TaxID=1144342 RepID=UPI00026F6D71|nr:efflux transporter outer membrane subunit [Herbaspirillum sp. YR522]EJN09983.1 efflux transporter, outer membrane factor lipoprotein, NodT family [Herbaspirillum sp. YR522]
MIGFIDVRRAALRLCPWLASLVIGGCAVGPDYVAPTPALASRWAAHEATAGAVFSADAVDDAWWQRFGDPVLSALIERMIRDNLDLQMASSRLQQSLAASGATAAAGWPQLRAEGSALRARNSANGLLDPSGHAGQAPYNVWQGAVQASWELDLWGRLAREREAAGARVEMAGESRHAALVSLSATLAQDYIRLRGAQHQLRLGQDDLALARQVLRLTRVRQAEGVATRFEVEQARAQVAEVEASLPALQQRACELANAIGLLLATPPQALSQMLEAVPAPAAVRIPDMQQPVAVGLPSQLAQRRPDIRRAQAALHAATAEIGVAEGDFYPRITLSGSVGAQAMQLSDLGSWSSRSVAIGPGVSLPLFDGARLRAMLRLRNAQQVEAALQYRKTVLGAWHEVDDAMNAWQAGAVVRDRLGEALAHSRAAWDDAQQQYAQGTVDYLHVLTVEQGLLRHRRAFSDSQAASSLALVDLYRALGGGWQQALPPVAVQPVIERTPG